MDRKNHIQEMGNNIFLNNKAKKKIRGPLISIIIPVYNRAELIPKTLDNIRANKYRPLEIILINDGSTDDSLKILQDFKEQYNREEFIIKILDQPNMGAPVARNHGFDQSTGEYIQFLDSDDLIANEKFHIQVKIMDKDNADFGLCDFELILTMAKKRIYQSNSHKIFKVINSWESFGCGSPLLRRDLAEKISWNDRLHRQQDVDFFLKAALLSKRIAYVNEPLYYYINHDNDRISDCYADSSPVYLRRIQSLIPMLKYNLVYTSIAIVNLFARIIYHYSIRYVKNRLKYYSI